MRIITISSIQHHIGGVADTYGAVTGIEDAILLPDHVGYPRILI